MIHHCRRIIFVVASDYREHLLYVCLIPLNVERFHKRVVGTIRHHHIHVPFASTISAPRTDGSCRIHTRCSSRWVTFDSSSCILFLVPVRAILIVSRSVAKGSLPPAYLLDEVRRNLLEERYPCHVTVPLQPWAT
jgi:hypothetical protein